MFRLIATMVARLLAPGGEPAAADAPEATPPPGSPSSSTPAPEVGRRVALPRTRVVVGIDAHDPSIGREGLDQVLAGHFADTGLQYRVATLAATGEQGARLAWASTYAREPDVLAVFWIDRDDGEHSLYLFEPQRGTTWVRELPPSSDPDELLESLGTMVRGISLWLGDGAPPGMDAVEVAPPEPEPEPEPEPVPEPVAVPVEPLPSPTPPPAPAWGLELAYTGGNLARQAPWQSGGSLALDVEWPVHVVGQVGVAVLSPAILEPLPETTVWRVPVHLAVGYRFRSGRALRPLLDAAVVVEPMWWRAQSTPEVLARSGRTARIAVAPGLGLRWTLWRGLCVVLHARADLRILDADLVVSQGGRRVSRLSPHVVAAFVRAGLAYAF